MTLPGMSDGRCFTSFISSCKLNENIKRSVNVSNNNSYRQFLQDNADVIMSDFETICNKESQSECFMCKNIANDLRKQ
tara:strand:+ start:945 stop:1178 length:234 start_codon:yes stop_codon:yes gene_type:complete